MIFLAVFHDKYEVNAKRLTKVFARFLKAKSLEVCCLGIG